MTLAEMAWLGMAAYAVHILEEYTLDWRNWARNVLGLPVEWSDFYVTNGIVVALGIAQAELAVDFPIAALSYAALMLVNAVLFHVFPFIGKGGRFSPGLITAVLLFLPYGILAFWRAIATGQASPGTAVIALVIGSLTMAFPIVLLKVKAKPYFAQNRSS